MAQVVKLKRTSVQGRIPSISNLELGELAINTHDGRIFFEKDDGTLSIQEILTTDSQNSGSFNLTGAISASSLSISGDTAIGGNLILGGNITIGDATTDVINVTAGFSGSLLPKTNLEDNLGSPTEKWRDLYVGTASADFFVGDGSGLVNVIAEVSEQNSVTASFSNQDQIQITHNFDSRNIHVSVYDYTHQLIIPENVILTTTNTVDIGLSAAGSGYVVVAKGGHLLGGVYVDDVTKVSDTFTNETSYTVTHSFGTKDVIAIVYDINDEQIIPQLISTPTNSSVQIGFQNPTSGRVVVVKAGHVVSGSIPFENITNKPDLISGSVTGSNVVGSDTITSIETLTSSAYAAITPVSGTLYIITD